MSKKDILKSLIPLDNLIINHKKFNIKDAKLTYSDFRYSKNVSKFKILLSRFMEMLANKNIHFSERFWAYWVGGFYGIYVKLLVKK